MFRLIFSYTAQQMKRSLFTLYLNESVAFTEKQYSDTQSKTYVIFSLTELLGTQQCACVKGLFGDSTMEQQTDIFYI